MVLTPDVCAMGAGGRSAELGRAAHQPREESAVGWPRAHLWNRLLEHFCHPDLRRDVLPMGFTVTSAWGDRPTGPAVQLRGGMAAGAGSHLWLSHPGLCPRACLSHGDGKGKLPHSAPASLVPTTSGQVEGSSVMSRVSDVCPGTLPPRPKWSRHRRHGHLQQPALATEPSLRVSQKAGLEPHSVAGGSFWV